MKKIAKLKTTLLFMFFGFIFVFIGYDYVVGGIRKVYTDDIMAGLVTVSIGLLLLAISVNEAVPEK